jgi:hypothetical protein
MSSAGSFLARATTTAVGLVAFAAAALLCLGHATALRATWPPEADNYYLPSSRTLRVASLGHHELAADLVAAKGNVYFGTQVLSHGQQRWLAQYVTTATDLDPYFHRLYLSGAAMILYNGQNIDVATVLASSDLLERGAQAFPYDWEIKFQLGFNYLFELPRLVGRDDPRVPGWRQRGVEALRQAALFEHVASWLPGLVARMLTRSGSDEMAVRHLEQAYTVAASEEARLQIRAKLNQLHGEQASQRLEQERKRLEQLASSRYPYAPEAFSLITGPRHPPAVDLRALAEPPARAAPVAQPLP